MSYSQFIPPVSLLPSVRQFVSLYRRAQGPNNIKHGSSRIVDYTTVALIMLQFLPCLLSGHGFLWYTRVWLGFCAVSRCAQQRAVFPCMVIFPRIGHPSGLAGRLAREVPMHRTLRGLPDHSYEEFTGPPSMKFSKDSRLAQNTINYLIIH